jgi:hypothetical protein
VANTPWYISNPRALQDLRERVTSAYPDLVVTVHGSEVVVTGSFPLVDGDKIYDHYEIELVLPPTYPKGIPTLRETGGRIPRSNADRHMNDDGACLFVPDQYCYEHPGGLDAVSFLRGPVLGYLLGSSLVEHGASWPHGARDHGAKGILDFYGEITGTREPAAVTRFLEAIVARKFGGHHACPCGSAERLRSCHSALVADLRRRIPQDVARETLAHLRKEYPHA